jgi:DNA polymerase III subunit beta
VPEPPPAAGSTSAGPFAAALAAVAGAASRDDALPIFTGVRLHAAGDRLSLLATDRYRLAAATLPWEPAEGAGSGDPASFDALAPADVLAEVARQASGADAIALHADTDRLAVSWDGASVATGQLAAPFPDDRLRALLSVTVACAIEVEAGALAAAIRRAALYGGPRGTVTLRTGDAEITVSGQAGHTGQGGESEESVKAAVSGDRLVRSYLAPLLGDALRAFAGRRVRISLQEGERATALTAAGPEPAAGDLHYLVVPLRIANPG